MLKLTLLPYLDYYAYPKLGLVSARKLPIFKFLIRKRQRQGFLSF